MPINNPRNVQFYTGYNTFKNFETVSNTLSIPLTSYTAGQFKQYTMTIPLSSDLALTQVLHNFSLDATKYWLGNGIFQVNFIPNSNFSTQVRCSYSATTLTVDVYVINQVPATVNSTAFDITTTVRRFVTPFS